MPRAMRAPKFILPWPKGRGHTFPIFGYIFNYHSQCTSLTRSFHPEREQTASSSLSRQVSTSSHPNSPRHTAECSLWSMPPLDKISYTVFVNSDPSGLVLPCWGLQLLRCWDNGLLGFPALFRINLRRWRGAAAETLYNSRQNDLKSRGSARSFWLLRKHCFRAVSWPEVGITAQLCTAMRLHCNTG